MGSYSWDTTPTGVDEGKGYNIWEIKTPSTFKSDTDSSRKADVNILLNEWYLGEEDSDNPVICYGGESELPKTCPIGNIKLKAGVGEKDLIDDAVWNLGAYTYTKANGYAYLLVLDTCNKERGTLTGSGFGEIDKTEWTGKVALPYITDFEYASTNYECRNDSRAGLRVNGNKCAKALGNWMHDSSYTYWMLSPVSNRTSNVFVAQVIILHTLHMASDQLYI